MIKDSGDIVVFIPSFGRYTILTDTVETDVELDPAVFVKNGRVLYHTGEDMGPYQSKILGLAIDVGTTTLVMQVVDLEPNCQKESSDCVWQRRDLQVRAYHEP